MPVVTDTPVKAYAHCPRPVCRDSNGLQVEVDAIRQEVGWTFVEGGGDIPGVERSHVVLHFANEADVVCGCGTPRELAETLRPSYQPLSGHPQDGLLKVGPFDPNVVNTVEDAKVAELEAKNAALEAKLDAILDKLAEGKGA